MEKTIATITVEINWENKYDATGEPDMDEAIKEHLNVDKTFGYEWDLEEDVAYVEGDFEIIDIETFKVVKPTIGPLPFCEHCGQNHMEFGCEFDVDGVQWCLSCYLSDKPNSDHLYAYYADLEKKGQIKYLQKKIEELKK